MPKDLEVKIFKTKDLVAADVPCCRSVRYDDVYAIQLQSQGWTSQVLQVGCGKPIGPSAGCVLSGQARRVANQPASSTWKLLARGRRWLRLRRRPGPREECRGCTPPCGFST